MKNKIVVLIADDDPNDRHLLQHALQRNGAHVELHEVTDGAELTQYLKGTGAFANRERHPFPDLVLLDLKMPRRDGLDVLRWLRRHAEYRRTPIVMLSGSGLDKDVVAAYELGVNSYFSKPSKLDDLLRLIRLIIDYWAAAERPTTNDRPFLPHIGRRPSGKLVD